MEGARHISPGDRLSGRLAAKGVASPFYGGSAVGGVVNLVSRAPEGTDLLANATMLGGTDLIGWTGGGLSESLTRSVLVGLHRQDRRDRDADGWSDVPGYRRLVARPRVTWTAPSGASVFATLGATVEDRQGGTLPGQVAPDGLPFPEELTSQRYDGGVVARVPTGDGVWGLRGSVTSQRRDQTGDQAVERRVGEILPLGFHLPVV